MISFETFLVDDRTITRNNNPLKCFTLKCIEDTSIRTVPQQFKNDFDTSMFNANATNDDWDRINIPVGKNYSLTYTVNFAGIVFDAKLENFSASVKTKKDGTRSTIYVLRFTKELDASIDPQISAMLNVKELDANGKPQIVKYATTLGTEEDTTDEVNENGEQVNS